MNKIMASSIFEAIQGEGKNTGKYTLFIRLYTKHCFPNKKKCKFCDTVGQDYYKPVFSESEILRRVKEIKPSMITITGGEFFRIDPLVAKDFMYKLNNVCDYIELETNGSLTIDQVPLLKHFNNVNISMKLENSGIDFEYDMQTLQSTTRLFEDKISWKFVVGKNTERDLEVINEIVYDINIKKTNVWLMGMTPNTNDFRRKLVELCIENKYNYSPRLHIDIYGDCVDFEV